MERKPTIAIAINSDTIYFNAVCSLSVHLKVLLERLEVKKKQNKTIKKILFPFFIQLQYLGGTKKN